MYGPKYENCMTSFFVYPGTQANNLHAPNRQPIDDSFPRTNLTQNFDSASQLEHKFFDQNLPLEPLNIIFRS